MQTETALRSQWSEHEDSDDQSIKRPTSFRPSSFMPMRFSAQSGSLLSAGKLKSTGSSDSRFRRASTQSNGRSAKSASKMLDTTDSVVSVPSENGHGFDAHSLASLPSYDGNSRRSTVSKKRGSLLSAASDALGFKFGRKRKSTPRLPMPIILPDVIEISAPRHDEELEERERLRDAAAQSIGLDPILMSGEDTPMERDENEASLEDIEEAKMSESVHLDGRLPLDMVVFDSFTQSSSEPTRSRHSQQTHSRSTSASISLPGFPCLPANLTEFVQASSTLPKYYPSTSLRIFSLTKQWKSRYLILSSPPTSTARGPAVSYLHIFRASGAEEKEMERLEINEDSVVFVAEEEIGHRRSVVQVGGVDVGAVKKDHSGNAQAMWFLQIVDPFEAQKWIALIKNLILGQRSLRAGLGIPVHSLGTVEPRGDMDVMLDMRRQAIIPTPPQTKLHATTFSSSRSLPNPVPHPFAAPDQNCASSISSNSSRSPASTPKPQTGAVSTLKTLFTGVGRPRSPSRSESIDEAPERGVNEDSFGSMGNNLLSMIRPNSSDLPSPRLVPSRSYPTTPTQEFFNPGSSSEQRIDRKISTEYAPSRLQPGDLSSKTTKTLSMGSLSLPPAPRKRSWVVGLPSHPAGHTSMYNHSNGNGSVAGSFGIGRDANTLVPTPMHSAPRTPDAKGRAPSLNSVSTFASGENGSNVDRSSTSTKAKRWSRRGSLPKRLTPPNGPLPSAPVAETSRNSIDGAGNAWQSSSSIRSATSQVSGLPSFSKRGSNSSGVSNNSSTLLQPLSNTGGTPVSSHRLSVPPPRPIPNFAPPPAPAPEPDPVVKRPKSVSIPKSSLRDSVANRAFRLSLNAPKPPPTSNLPPRPDEPEYQNQGQQAQGRSSTSSSTNTHRSSGLPSIPVSPIPTPLPPPTYPLPPTPVNASTPSTSRNSSMKQRLRILSAPSPSSTTLSSDPRASRPLMHTMSASMELPREAFSPPATPIGERITNLQNDPSFLQLHSPGTPTIPEIKILRRLPHSPEQNGGFPELASLPPPPRRGSKQIPVVDTSMDGVQGTLEVRPAFQGEEKHLSLTQQGSVISLGIVSM